MFKIIMYIIITIGILHFTLYYFNFDFNFENFNYFKTSTHNNSKSNELSNELSKQLSNESLIDSINELKTLNECINNGEINPFFS
jgi:uncharacterized protein YxeA